MKGSAGRILTSHAGSLPRPPELRRLLAAGDDAEPAELAEAVQAATADTVARQIAAGIDVINDGEMGRESFFTYVRHRMTGFGGHSDRRLMADMTMYEGYRNKLLGMTTEEHRVSLLRAPKAVAEIGYGDSAAIQAECDRLNQLLTQTEGVTEAFMTAASPGIVAAAMQNDHYPDMESYVDALAVALANEYRAIVDAGLLLQIDAPDLAMERHALFQDRPVADFIAFAECVMAAINRALAGIPADRVRLHVCWGNYEGPHVFDIPLEEIWPTIAKARAQGLLLALANPRHEHEYHCFENLDLPADGILIAGVIDTTTNYVEHPKTVADRIVRIAGAVGDPNRVIAATDCGFETAAGFVSVEEQIAWNKLEALTEGAALASQTLYG
ncbi:MAG: cobalamin-independent methionine synthase II family protein [Alphaproteobacteria bacterium]|jgi:5-methyltetrahydropteroyltriglutamate--homocysteine methyltransferase|nr:cobalamin-independent methionine synthase II family protein [Alphaproteobacteria bacterium]MDP6564232.1 cobalamin-independent methionine synthase II family protein [Alphaproteobacteria bacterium]MDP6814004.1 cobalamin-independent methionine synthase II family protein [Alphaproteobacteria bacterium]